MGRDDIPHGFLFCQGRFNPRARMGRDMRGVPVVLVDPRFNPRARMGRDLPLVAGLLMRSSFNPRARMGRDIDLSMPALDQMVSIHAPVWGATACAPALMSDPTFQSTRPYGARRADGFMSAADKRFQSTRPYGARPI